MHNRKVGVFVVACMRTPESCTCMRKQLGSNLVYNPFDVRDRLLGMQIAPAAFGYCMMHARAHAMQLVFSMRPVKGCSCGHLRLCRS